MSSLCDYLVLQINSISITVINPYGWNIFFPTITTIAVKLKPDLTVRNDTRRQRQYKLAIQRSRIKIISDYWIFFLCKQTEKINLIFFFFDNEHQWSDIFIDCIIIIVIINEWIIFYPFNGLIINKKIIIFFYLGQSTRSHYPNNTGNQPLSSIYVCVECLNIHSHCCCCFFCVRKLSLSFHFTSSATALCVFNSNNKKINFEFNITVCYYHLWWFFFQNQTCLKLIAR